MARTMRRIRHHRYFILTILALFAGLVAVACQPSPPPRLMLTPFPTMTLGASLIGELPRDSARPIDNTLGLTNPSTAVALINQPTPTPQYGVCPPLNDAVTLPDAVPQNAEATARALLNYLNAGGDPDDVQNHLRQEWDIMDETGYWRDEVDLTGDGRGEIVLGFVTSDGIGMLMVITCRDGRYDELIRLISDTEEVPSLIWLGDMNNNPPAEVVVARRRCNDANACEYETFILSWDAQRGRLVNLLDEELFTLDLPAVADYDGDEVAELIVRLQSRGTSATGPLRTGINIYDWNGSVYTLSIIQLDAPIYRIQYVHEADRLFARQAFRDAVRLYEIALTQDNLRYWFNDGIVTVDSYALYRLVLGYTALGDVEALTPVIAELNERFPADEDNPVESLPVYVHLAYVYLNTLLDTDDLHLACVATLRVVDDRPEALNLLNRYGSRSPNYRRLDLCPF